MKHDMRMGSNSAGLADFPHVWMVGRQSVRKLAAGNLPLHINPGIEICYIHKGRFDWTFEGRPVCALPGTTTITLPWQKHGGTRAVMDIGELSWIIVRPARFDRSGKLQLGPWSSLPPEEQNYIASQLLKAPTPIVVPKHPAVRSIFEELLMEFSTQRQGRVWRANRLIDELLLLLARALERSTLGRQRAAFDVNSLYQAVRQKPGRKWTLEELCILSGWSKSALNPRVRQATGYSSMEYVLMIRQELAQERLRHTDLTITEIAMELGFFSSQHFSMAFRQREGMSPSEFRQAHRR